MWCERTWLRESPGGEIETRYDREVSFFEELLRFLPQDLPDREASAQKAALHLELIEETNKQFNLTRILDPREAAIKHTVDSLLPWKLFAAAAGGTNNRIVDAGSGPGFPGIPLAIALPGIRFVLLESTQKKARFIESAVERLGLENVEVHAVRAEDWFKTNRAPLFTARAVAPLDRAIALFGPALRTGTRGLFYKGPDAEAEIAAAAAAAKSGFRMRVVERYELPESLGTRTMVELSAAR
jgi:16S rRNA (guanine527-N7)-methyltransferase